MFNEDRFKFAPHVEKMKNQEPMLANGKIDNMETHVKNMNKQAVVYSEKMLNSIDDLEKKAPESEITKYVSLLSKDEQKTLDMIFENMNEDNSDLNISFEIFSMVAEKDDQAEIVRALQLVLAPTTNPDDYENAKHEIVRILEKNMPDNQMLAAI